RIGIDDAQLTQVAAQLQDRGLSRIDADDVDALGRFDFETRKDGDILVVTCSAESVHRADVVVIRDSEYFDAPIYRPVDELLNVLLLRQRVGLTTVLLDVRMRIHLKRAAVETCSRRHLGRFAKQGETGRQENRIR